MTARIDRMPERYGGFRGDRHGGAGAMEWAQEPHLLAPANGEALWQGQVTVGGLSHRLPGTDTYAKKTTKKKTAFGAFSSRRLMLL